MGYNLSRLIKKEKLKVNREIIIYDGFFKKVIINHEDIQSIDRKNKTIIIKLNSGKSMNIHVLFWDDEKIDELVMELQKIISLVCY